MIWSFKRKLWRDFARSESGAITVDWVVLTAAVTFLGVAAMLGALSGSNQLASQIGTALSGVEIDFADNSPDDNSPGDNGAGDNVPEDDEDG